MGVPKCRSKSAPSIPSRRLHPHLVEWAISEQATICNAVQCDTASHAEIPLTSLLMQMVRHAQNCGLDQFLN
jgi:hypothetical protein